MYCTVHDRLGDRVEDVGGRQNSAITVLNAIATSGWALIARSRPKRLEASRHTSTAIWVQLREEITGIIIGVVNYSYYSTVEGEISTYEERNRGTQPLIDEGRTKPSKKRQPSGTRLLCSSTHLPFSSYCTLPLLHSLSSSAANIYLENKYGVDCIN